MIKRALAAICLMALAFPVFGAISSPADRLAQLEIVKGVISKEVVPLVVEEGELLRNPFNRELAKTVKAEVQQQEEEETKSPENLLQTLSESINPTGIFAINGEYYLMFKEKRLKAGSIIDVDYEGRTYQVSIDRVMSNAYSLRMGDARIQQKLK